MSKPQKLTAQQEKALAALVANASQLRASEIAGVAEITVWRWLQIPMFRERLEAMRHDATAGAIGFIQTNSTDAAAALLAIVNDTKAPHAARVAASKAVLDFALRSIETDRLARDLDELKTLFSELKLGETNEYD